MAATYHWTPRFIEAELTDELLVLYLDEEQDRLDTRFRSRVEVVRQGTVFAHNLDAYRRWLHSLPIPKGRSLSGDALEAAVMRIAALFPENVVRQTVSA